MLYKIEGGHEDLNIYKNKQINIKLSNLIVGYTYFCIAVLICIILPSENTKTGIYYCSVILSAVFFARIAQNTKLKFGFNFFISISLIILFLNLGLRNFSANDDPTYIRVFNDVREYGWFNQFLKTTMEPGYLILNNIVGIFTDNYLYMQLISSFIPLILFYRKFKKDKNKIDLSMAVFLLSTMVYFQMLSTALVRMFIAMGIAINSYDYIVDGNYKKYTLTILISSLFHYSSLFMLILVYFAIDKNRIEVNGKKFISLLFIFTPIVFVIIAKTIVPILGTRYAQYGTLGRFELDIMCFDTVPILILLLINSNKIKEIKLKQFKLCIVIFTLSTVVSLYSSIIHLGRLIFYTNIALFIAAPMISKSIKGRYSYILFNLIIIIYGFVYLYATQFLAHSNTPYLFPYQNIFFTI